MTRTLSVTLMFTATAGLAACLGTEEDERDMRQCEYIEGEVTPEMWMDAGVRCDEGETTITPARFQYPCDEDGWHCDGGCTIPPPCGIAQCSPCGNGVCECERGENICNCEDCQ